MKQKTLKDSRVREFGQVLGGDLDTMKRKAVGDGRVTMFDSTGVAVQDVVIAKMVYQALNDTAHSKL